MKTNHFNHSIIRQIVIAIGAFALWASPLWAIDTVTLRSTGKSVLGEIGAINRTEVTIKPKTGEAIKVPANDIATIKWEGESAKLGLARSDEEGGRLEKALDSYLEIAKDAKSGNMKAWMELLITRVSAKLALDDPSKIDDAVKRLEAFTKSYADHFGYFDATNLLGHLYVAKGDFPKAQQAFENLAKAPWNDYRTAAKVSVGKVQLKQNKVEDAAKSFDDAAAGKAESDAEKARRNEALVGKAACLVKQQKNDDAMKLIDEVIKAASLDEPRAMAEAYNLQGDLLQAQNKLKEAAIAYLHVPVLFPKEKAAHAEALYHLHKISGLIGQPDRATEAREDLLANFPNSEWAKKLGEAAPAATDGAAK